MGSYLDYVNSLPDPAWEPGYWDREAERRNALNDRIRQAIKRNPGITKGEVLALGNRSDAAETLSSLVRFGFVRVEKRGSALRHYWAKP